MEFNKIETYGTENEVLNRISELKREGISEDHIHVIADGSKDSSMLTDNSNIHYTNAEGSFGDKFSSFFSGGDPEEKVLEKFNMSDGQKDAYVTDLKEGRILLYTDSEMDHGSLTSRSTESDSTINNPNTGMMSDTPDGRSREMDGMSSNTEGVSRNAAEGGTRETDAVGSDAVNDTTRGTSDLSSNAMNDGNSKTEGVSRNAAEGGTRETDVVGSDAANDITRGRDDLSSNEMDDENIKAEGVSRNATDEETIGTGGAGGVMDESTRETNDLSRNTMDERTRQTDGSDSNADSTAGADSGSLARSQPNTDHTGGDISDADRRAYDNADARSQPNKDAEETIDSNEFNDSNQETAYADDVYSEEVVRDDDFTDDTVRDRDLDRSARDTDFAAGTTGSSNLNNNDTRNMDENSDREKMELHEERVDVDKNRRQAGEVEVNKETVHDKEEFDVPVTREEVTIERRPVNEEKSATGSAGNINKTDGVYEDEDSIHVPVHEEEVEVNKKDVVKEEIVVNKKEVKDNVHVEEDVRKEEADISDSTTNNRRDRDNRKR